jgi:A/G-specific adenine glycosylase
VSRKASGTGPGVAGAGQAAQCIPGEASDTGHEARAAPPKNAGFAARVIAWQRQHGRHDLPWQNTRDPYRIWVSEIMLQQTQVSAVIPYYERFLARFPDLASLAAADEDAVLALWSGLGYYARARNLHRAARVVRDQHGGVFPTDQGAMWALPGVGRSTASAICVFSRGARHAILDGNVKRVLSRHFGVEGFPGEKRVESALWALSESLLPETELEAYTQGLMDLGASVCMRTRPPCAQCPLRETCVAHREGRTVSLPAPRPTKALPERDTTMAVLVSGGEVLLEKRPAPGIWGGLWCFPEVEGSRLQQECAMRFAVEVSAVQLLDEVRHGFTHFHLRIQPVLAQVRRNLGVEAPGRLWLTPEDARGAAIPVPVRKILAALAARTVTVRPAESLGTRSARRVGRRPARLPESSA